MGRSIIDPTTRGATFSRIDFARGRFTHTRRWRRLSWLCPI